MSLPASIGLAAASLAGVAFWIDFTSWKNTGTGGTPPTVQGYMKIRRWGLYLFFKRQNLLDDSSIPDTGAAYLNSALIPQRDGVRPKLTRWTLPQRQYPDTITSKARETLLDMPSQFANTTPYSKYLTSGPSKTEGGTGPTVYVNKDVDTINPNAGKVFYEVAHVHPQENSLHVYLSPRDAKEVVQKGWGQLFPVTWLAPPSWVMVYAPRDEKEVEIVREIVRAACCFGVGKELKDGQ